MKNKKVALGILVLLVLAIAVSGCTSKPPEEIKKEVANQTIDVVKSVDNVQNILDDIDKSLSGK